MVYLNRHFKDRQKQGDSNYGEEKSKRNNHSQRSTSADIRKAIVNSDNK